MTVIYCLCLQALLAFVPSPPPIGNACYTGYLKQIKLTGSKYPVMSDILVKTQLVVMNNDTFSFEISATAICEIGWQAFRQSCYKKQLRYATWHRAKVLCASLGGHLLKIDDAVENNYFSFELKGSSRVCANCDCNGDKM